ncbi:peptidyl-prolyl cis-trans isomerase [Mucisphaera sp.]|uniref:peptidylprolyl isomerase n=1 Tax=Mucisphaera sp. TaxID=2913024 RepID=UPI003D0E8752
MTRLATTLICLSLLHTGCSSMPDDAGTGQTLTSDDFVLDPRPAPPEPAEDASPAAASAATPTAPTDQHEADPIRRYNVQLGSADDAYLQRSNETRPLISEEDTSTSWPIDGMVGQVNGRAIYARTVLEPLEIQLATLARQLDRQRFQAQAQQAVVTRLQEIIQSRLILAAAERDLDERGRLILDASLRFHREELVRQFGRGSLAIAEQQIMLREGITLDDKVEEFRQNFLIRGYQMKNLRPLIDVRRRDIERYYREHEDQFNPPAERTIRMIRVNDDDEAQRVQDALAEGYTFEAVAATPVNQMLGGGLIDGLVGEQPLRQDNINQAIVSLEVGAWTGPIPFGQGLVFIELVENNVPPRQTLTDAQQQIRNILVNQQLRELSQTRRIELVEEASHTPIREMGEAIMDIVMTRYTITAANAGG